MKVVTDPRAGPAPEKATAAPNEDGGGGEKKGKAKKEKGNKGQKRKAATAAEENPSASALASGADAKRRRQEQLEEATSDADGGDNVAATATSPPESSPCGPAVADRGGSDTETEEKSEKSEYAELLQVYAGVKDSLNPVERAQMEQELAEVKTLEQAQKPPVRRPVQLPLAKATPTFPPLFFSVPSISFCSLAHVAIHPSLL